MKAIKLLVLSSILFVFSACREDENHDNVAQTNPFVRFSLKLDDNGNPYQAPQTPEANDLEVTEYTHDKLTQLKIPVILSSETLSETVTVYFDYQSVAGNDLTDLVEILPADKQLSFSENQLTDTIYVKLKQVVTSTESIQFNLTNISDENIRIGYDRTSDKMDELTVHLSEGERTYSFNTNYQEISGQAGESFDFKVLFPNGYVSSDVDGQTLFAQPLEFDYTITQQPLTEDDEVTYTFTLNENLPEEVEYNLLLQLQDLNGYIQESPNIFQITKPIAVDREGNPSTNWYDVSNPYYRNFAHHWRMNNGACEWRKWNVMSVPVAVEPNSEFDANGDGYHDFKMGMIGPNAPIGTNIFDLKRILDGEDGSSPGLNLTEVLEFFPENGNSTTQGTVKVISQIMNIISYPDGNSYNIPISGSGTYYVTDASQNRYEMRFQVTFDFTEINGTTQTHEYYMYNYNESTYPTETPNVTCNEVIEVN